MIRQPKIENVPECLKELPQWVLWKAQPRKIPFQINGQPASAGEPETWTTFQNVVNNLTINYSGIGFEFHTTDPYCGIDFDGCRDPKTGKVERWAKEWILECNSYAEVSPTETGIKCWVIGKNPAASGRKWKVEQPKICVEKEPGVEIYDQGRFFCVTGYRLSGLPTSPQPRQPFLDKLFGILESQKQTEHKTQQHYQSGSTTSVVQRAMAYVAKLPPSISGDRGHDKLFRAACICVLGFGLNDSESISVLEMFNQRCDPHWSERELMHKIRQANKQPGERGYLRNANPSEWINIKIPDYKHDPKGFDDDNSGPKITTLHQATKNYVEMLESGHGDLMELGLGDVDYAIGGGIEKGEMILLCARPSHGKSAIALQCVHAWAANQRPSVIISEEMSAMALGKRTLQFISDVPQEHWKTSITSLKEDVSLYGLNAEVRVVEGCGSIDNAVQQIEIAHQEIKAEIAVVDYVQFLRAAGKSRYEQVTASSVALKRVAQRLNIPIVVLCQLNRQLENRPKFEPKMSDIKESGQLEQDADVVLFLVWPHRIASDDYDPFEYQIFVEKNRNRAINQRLVKMRFEPSRQRILPPKVERNVQFDDFNEGRQF